MSKVRTIVTLAGVALGAAGVAVATKKIKNAYQLVLENCTEDTLDVYLGTVAVPDALALHGFQPGEKRRIDLTRIPLAEHDVVYIRFPETATIPGYKRTLVYDTAECSSPMHGMIVDYGEGNYDVKLVRVG